ncbi:MAG: mechanosensitive ion channel family protein [Cyanobacteriota bacterium]|nr:mechanosensitive ion channel family protein [Cyanobacteriota bacterium]
MKVNNIIRGKGASIAKSLIVALLSFTLVVSWGGAAWGQIPFFNLEGSNSDRPIVDFFNRPYKCGNLVCSRVWFIGVPILEIASEPTTEEEAESDFRAELRAKRIQNNLKEILKASQASSDSEDSSSRDAIVPQETEKTRASNDTTDNTQNSDAARPPIILLNKIPRKYQNYRGIRGPEAHPNLPDILVGTLNNETVIYVPERPGYPNRKILTITTADVLHNSIPTEELAYQWREIVRSRLNKALKESEQQTKYPLKNLKIIVALFAVVLIVSWFLAYVQNKLRLRYKTIRSELQKLESSIAIDPESASGEKLAASREEPEQIGDGERPEAKMPYPKNGSASSGGLESFWRNLPKFSLKKQKLLKEQINILLLLLQGLLWMRSLILLWGTGSIFAIYPNTRPLGVLLILKTLPAIGIWVLVTILDKISYFAIDFNLNKWVENAQFNEEFSQRYALRVSTYSSALKSLSSVIFGLAGIIWTAEILGIATTVLASAGIMAAALAYFSQNLVRDAINGLLILITDRYAVGDIILVGDVGGLVERMNLYMTQLRSADGELITIPNGSITVVRNLTKNWSRVNFTIEVAYDADIKRALQVLREVADQFYSEPEWKEHLVEPIEVLGIDEMSHAGMLVRIWLKTQPVKQWLVGREFRLRVKQAFDREGIAIGIPQRSLDVKNYVGFPNTNGNGKERDRVGHG